MRSTQLWHFLLVFWFAIFSPANVSAKLLQIIHTNDLHANFDSSDTPGRGGYAAVKGLIDSLRDAAALKGIETLTVDAGDFADGSIYRYAEKGGVEILAVSDDCYAKLSDLQSPEGAAVAFAPSALGLEMILGEPRPRLLVAAGVQDPGNAGALVRTAEAAGAAGCVFLDSIDVYAPKFLRAAMGGVFTAQPAVIQSVYAPEFTAHSAGHVVRIRD